MKPTRKEKRRRTRKEKAAKAPALASNYIESWESLKPGDRIVLCLRVSGHAQRRNRNLKGQEAFLRNEAKKIGADIIDVIYYVGSGWQMDWLLNAATIARKKGAILVAESTDRLVRHPDFHTKDNPNIQAGKTELDALQAATAGITLVTFIPPNAAPNIIRSHQAKRGQWSRRNKGGRPKKHTPGRKKTYREKSLLRALELRRSGLSYRKIARMMGVSKTTIHRWIMKAKNPVPFLL